MSLVIKFNHVQKRLGRDRLPLIAKGQDMEPEVLRSGAWIEPTHSRIILEPYCLTQTWLTSNSGNYAKQALSAFSTTGTWETRAHPQLIVGPWLGIADTATNGTLLSTTTYSKNRGHYIALHGYVQTGSKLVMRFGSNSSASLSGGVGYEYYSDGTINIHKAGVQVGQVKISGGDARATKPNQVTELFVLPYSHREILFYSNASGGAASFLFDDIAEDAADPEITPASKFWLEIVEGGTQVMTAPLLFPTSGYVTSIQQSFIEAPDTLDTLESWPNPAWVGTQNYQIHGHPAYVGTQTASAAARDWAGSAFSANGTNIEARLRITLGTDNAGYTPTVYGSQLAYAGTFADTDGTEEFEATDYFTRAVLSVPDDPTGVAWDLEVKEPDTLAADVPNIQRATNTPILFEFGGVTLTDAIINTPDWSLAALDEASRVVLDASDTFKLAESFRFAEPIPLDALPLENVITFFAAHCGIEAADITVSSTALDLASNTVGTTNDWSIQVEPGESAGEWLQRIHDDYAATWLYGIRPKSGGGIEFFSTDPADLGTTALVTLYPSDEDAATIGLHTGLEIPKHVYINLGLETLEPEATEVRVSGVDLRTKRLLQAFKVDTAAEDATTAPTSRPANWVGCKRRYGLFAPEITSQSVCNQVCELLYDRLTPTRELAEFETKTLLVDPADDRPLWRGDNVRLYGQGTYRIISFGAEFLIQDGTNNIVRCTYVAEKVADEPS